MLQFTAPRGEHVSNGVTKATDGERPTAKPMKGSHATVVFNATEG